MSKRGGHKRRQTVGWIDHGAAEEIPARVARLASFARHRLKAGWAVISARSSRVRVFISGGPLESLETLEDWPQTLARLEWRPILKRRVFWSSAGRTLGQQRRRLRERHRRVGQ